MFSFRINFAIFITLLGFCTAIPFENPANEAPHLIDHVDQPFISNQELSPIAQKLLSIDQQIILEPPSDISVDQSEFFDSRIVEGSPAHKDAAPWMVALVVGRIVKSFTCGGSILSHNCILTAAHCIYGDSQGNLLDTYHAIGGTNIWNRGGIIIELGRYRNHPLYNSLTIKYDIGVITTRTVIPFSETVRPIRVNRKWIDGGVEATVTGWGTQWLWGSIPEELQYLKIVTLSEEECLRRVSEGVWGSSPPIDYNVEICTFHSTNHGMCHGDSGSGLIVKKVKHESPCLSSSDKSLCPSSGNVNRGDDDDDYESLIGVVSWGFPCAIGLPDVFVRGSTMWSFINDCGNCMNE